MVLIYFSPHVDGVVGRVDSEYGLDVRMAGERVAVTSCSGYYRSRMLDSLFIDLQLPKAH